ncbi:hypothetical protein [Klebsiella quasipneumoniae]|uniref:hypothetical protein n=1 Tax=Klebsiella quasipneumoniae TaxID=1463165 RepID=UPI003ECAD249
MEKGYFKVKVIKILQSILFKKSHLIGCFLFNPCLSDPISSGSGSASAPPGRSGPETQYLAVFSAGCNAICCVPPLPRDRLLTTGKRRFAYSLTVVHFRKLHKVRKVGSKRNGRPVI